MFKDNSKDKQGRLDRRTVLDEIGNSYPKWAIDLMPDIKTLENLQKAEEAKVVSKKLIFKSVPTPDESTSRGRLSRK